MNNLKDIKIEILESQIKELKESHDSLKKHYHEFVKATIQALKDISED
tara:strand:+ start:5481 stop:5624 length:144 start_codon:yes stop_codon:yes gene_type:complete